MRAKQGHELRKEFPVVCLGMSKAEVPDAFQNLRKDPEQAHFFCYIVVDPRCDRLSAHLRCLRLGCYVGGGRRPKLLKRNITNTQLLSEGAHMMAHLQNTDRWESGEPTPIPADVKVNAHSGGNEHDPFFTAGYVNFYVQIRAQHSHDCKTASIASAS